MPHCGGLTQGEFIYSLNLTDTPSDWVETEAVLGKGQLSVIEALKRVSARLPFKILGLDSDNGTEFINHHLHRELLLNFPEETLDDHPFDELNCYDHLFNYQLHSPLSDVFPRE